jgi:peptide/nickel transport system substrate-binding protein
MFLLFVVATVSYAAPTDSKTPRYGGVLKVTINADPASLDPVLESSESEQIPAAHIFETALSMDPEGDVHPSVCTFETKNGGMVIELSIREGIKFHDGSAVTIEDIAASATRWLNNVGFAKTHLGSALKSMEIRDGKLLFTFSKPAPLALTTIASWDRGLYIFPKAVCEKYPDAKIENADLIGTGPYKFKAHQADRFVILEKFKDYAPYESGGTGLAAAKRGYADTLYFYPVSDKTARITGVKTGEYDVGIGVPSNMISEMSKDPKLYVEVKELGIMPVMIFNSKQGPCTDVNLRNAILACLDMDELMMAAQGDKSLYYLNPSVMPKSSRWWLDESLGKYNKVDLGRAKKYLEASSYDGRPLVFITTKANDYFYKTALVVQQMAKQIGITIDLRVYDNPTLQQFRNQPDKFDIFSAGLTAKVDPTLVSFMDDGWSGFYSSDRKSKYLGIMNGESDFETRRKAWIELTKVLYDELPVITFGERTVAVVARSEVRNIFETTQKYYWNTWVDR